jgi:hypothetical protein
MRGRWSHETKTEYVMRTLTDKLTSTTSLLAMGLAFVTLAAALKALCPATLDLTYAEGAALVGGLVTEVAAFFRLRENSF